MGAQSFLSCLIPISISPGLGILTQLRHSALQQSNTKGLRISGVSWDSSLASQFLGLLLRMTILVSASLCCSELCKELSQLATD